MSIGNSQISGFSFSFMFAAKIIFYHHWSKVKKKKKKLRPVVKLYPFITIVTMRYYVESVLNILVKTHALYIYSKALMAFIKAGSII